MSKIVKITQETINSILKEFEQQLRAAKFSDGKLSYSHSFDNIERKAELKFTETAWIKMQSLVREFDKEIAWHGIAKRGDDPEKDEYIVSDILIYPQTVSGTTVTTNQEEYQNWLMGLDNDTFNNLRMQGHSHVNMGTTPSAVDTNLYNSILGQLDDTMFYIFLIWNKRGDKTVKIYDLAKNILFETSDIEVSIIEEEIGVEALLRDAKKKVKETGYVYSGGTYGVITQSFGTYTPPSTANKAPETHPAASASSHQVSAEGGKSDNTTPKNKKYKKKSEKSITASHSLGGFYDFY